MGRCLLDDYQEISGFDSVKFGADFIVYHRFSWTFDNLNISVVADILFSNTRQSFFIAQRYLSILKHQV